MDTLYSQYRVSCSVGIQAKVTGWSQLCGKGVEEGISRPWKYSINTQYLAASQAGCLPLKLARLPMRPFVRLPVCVFDRTPASR